MKKQMVVLCAALAVFAMTASMAQAAGYCKIIGDVKVAYTKAGCDAYYDDEDGTLTIKINEDGGNLTVTAGKNAGTDENWDGYVDIYIWADDTQVKAMTFTGRASAGSSPACKFFVVGQVYYVQKFTSTYTCIGGTDYYEIGLGGSAYTPWPDLITIKKGGCFAPLLGVDYSQVEKGVPPAAVLPSKPKE